MPMHKRKRTGVFPLIFVLELAVLCAAFVHAFAQSEEELVRGAKKEGQVMFWSSMRIDDSKALATGFEAKYPFLKVEIVRAGGEQIVNRAITEHMAGKTTTCSMPLRSKFCKAVACSSHMPRLRQIIILPALKTHRISGYRSTAATM